MSNVIETIRNHFPDRRVVVVGDVVADQFLHGTISRVSREAPVFILDHDETDPRPGGAANAAANVASLGGTAVIVGLVGNDPNGDLLRQSLTRSGVDCDSIIVDERIRTTTKVRVLAGQQHAPRQQVIRIDYADRVAYDDDIVGQLRERFSAACARANAIIISDYNYGGAHPEILRLARQRAEAANIPLLIDSRFRLGEFSLATAATPNQEEVEQILGKRFSDESCDELRRRLGYKALLVTAGNKGMTLFEDGAQPRHFEAVGPKEPVDVTGAGDTVIGAFTLGLSSGLSFAEAANLANHAGGIVVMKRGTATVSSAELIDSLEATPEPQNLSLASNRPA